MDLLLLMAYFIVVGSPVGFLAWLICRAWERHLDNDSESLLR